MKGTENHDKAEQSYEELFGLPFEIPVDFNDLKLGNLKIDYEEDRSLKPSSGKGRIKGLLNIIVYSELKYLSMFMKDDIELAIKFDEGKRDKMQKFIMLLSLFYMPPDQRSSPFLYYSVNDDDIFNLIKSEGPIALRNSITQVMLRIWLSDKNIAERKINKLRDSLVEHALGSKDKPAKIGRPGIAVVKTLGTDWVKVMHRDITSILRIAKKNRKYYQTDKVTEFIDQAFEEYMFSLKKKLARNQDSKETKEKLARLKKGLKSYERMKLPNPISECIENNTDLKAWFNLFRWEPYHLAKEIAAKLLGISVGTIHSIVYRIGK